MQTLISERSTSHEGYCFTLPAATIPENILHKDKELQRVVRRDGQCFARIERQTGPDTYHVRIASDPRYLHDSDQSYPLTVSATELSPATAIPLQARIIYLLAPGFLRCSFVKVQCCRRLQANMASALQLLNVRSTGIYLVFVLRRTLAPCLMVNSPMCFISLSVLPLTEVDNLDFSANRLTALETRFMLASQGALPAPDFKQRGS
jgi:hypothetical protein